MRVLDQRVLPRRLTYIECRTPRRVADAIAKMAVRGAPAIGLCAAYGMAVSATRLRGRSHAKVVEGLVASADLIASARPTAADLEAVVGRVLERARQAPPGFAIEAAVSEAIAVRKDLESACTAIASEGSRLLVDAEAVMTYCNTGALATGVSTGTALGAIEYRWRRRKNLKVWVPETRPFLQGSRLTAFELSRLGIPHTVVTDATCGHLMYRGAVDAVVVGADRIAANGDVANKIGTYALAVLAKRHGIPFVVAAPTSTFDLSVPSGADIPIEVRSGSEIVSSVWAGADEHMPEAFYPAFDVTPAELVSAIVCEKGVLEPPFEESIPRALRS